jgi:uncharacterized lipoprotein YehR (DUF1307 family)
MHMISVLALVSLLSLSGCGYRQLTKEESTQRFTISHGLAKADSYPSPRLDRTA